MRYVVNTLENGSFNLSKEAILFIADTNLSDQYLDNWEQYQKK